MENVNIYVCLNIFKNLKICIQYICFCIDYLGGFCILYLGYLGRNCFRYNIDIGLPYFSKSTKFTIGQTINSKSVDTL